MEILSRMLRDALIDMRSLLLELRQEPVQGKTLAELLDSLADATRARGKLAVVLSVMGAQTLPVDVTAVFYRVAQEALNNVINHADASRVTISCLLLPDRAELHILDDGRGFDPTLIAPGHIGLRIMRERTAGINGELTIQSTPNGGTEVNLLWRKPTGEQVTGEQP
jgi:signal transduction histidine kinase